MKKLIVANWKMRVNSEEEAVKLARASDHAGVIICPPFPFIPVIKRNVRRAALGAQDIFWEKGGAYTGEISGTILKNIGAQYVIVGHSERRKWLKETDQMVNNKIFAALTAGLTAILCVGEPLRVRKQGFAAAKKFVANQLKKDLESVSRTSRLIIAYEPLWAIGTGVVDTPEDSLQMARFIKFFLKSQKSKLKVNVLYGGSVTGKNAGHMLQSKEIQGALVGGASLKPAEFKKIIQACSLNFE